MLDCPALTLQSSRSLDTLSDLKLQQLEAELEGARHEAQGACQREKELKGECERLKEEMRMLQNQKQRDRVSVAVRRHMWNTGAVFGLFFLHAAAFFSLLQLAHVLRFSPVLQHLHANLISCSTSAGNEFSVQAVRCGVDKEGGRRAVSDPGAGVGAVWERGGGRAKMAHLQGPC